MKRIVVTICLLWTVRMFTWWSADRCSWVSFRLNKDGIWQWMWHFLLIIIASIIHKYWIKGIPRGYAIRSGRHPSGSQRPGPTARSARRPLTSRGMSAWPYRVTTQYSYLISNLLNTFTTVLTRYGWLLVTLCCIPTIFFFDMRLICCICWADLHNLLLWRLGCTLTPKGKGHME